ncbi:MAG: hypothetical protein ACYSRQ_04145 [Planctomycetota bacterium]|jgi:tetratricopeptide (TPR) repeat protein
MSKKIMLFILIFGLACSVVLAQISPEAGSGRMWPGGGQSTTFRSPNPVNLQGNNIVTRNVTGGTEFRGNVNYTSPYDFRAPTGSTQLDSFLRRTSGSVITQTPGTYTPYYNNLSSFRATSRQLTNPYLINSARTSRLRVDDRAASTSVPSTIRNEVDAYRYFGQSRRVNETTSPYILNDMRHQQRKTPPQVSQYLMGGQQLTDKQRQILDQQLVVDPKRISDQAPSLEYKQFNDEKSLQSYLRNNVDNDYLQQIETKTEENQMESEKPENFYENIEQQIMLLEKELQELAQKELMQKTQEPQNLEVETLKKEENVEGQQQTRPDLIDELGLSSYRAESVIGTEKKIATYMELKSAELVMEGEDWLSQQKFYRASDAFTSALIYKEDPWAYAGKCHALFGAGEYMSSAFFLFLAIDSDPGYIELEMDITTAMGGRDILENRLVDVEKWAQESDSPDLHFLRAYFYYRIGRFDMAQEAIDIALEKTPDSTALSTLKKAIDKKI